VGGRVAVTQPEPVGLHAVRRELVLDRERLVLAAPPALDADAVAEGVHHGVEVRADLQPEEADVVAGVSDDRDLRARGRRTQVVQEAAGEPRAADAARQDRDAHGCDPVTSCSADRARPT
jgi:hypothetical protein